MHYGLQERATNVVPVTSKVLAEKFDRIKDEIVAKFFLGEEKRISEPEILEKVKEIAKVYPSVAGHIPVLLCHQRFTNPTSSIREALGFPELTKGSRVLDILVFPKLSPITKLHGDELFNLWRQCILCHVTLWKAGVYHRDVGPGNMMWYREKLGRLMCVLNDYDLSSLANTPGPQGNERTGTVPFMALDLLTPQCQRGEVKHLYRHDLESFVWVFIWISLRYRNGSLLPPASRPSDEWATLGATTCRMYKSDFLDSLGEFYPSDVDRVVWSFIAQCVWLLKSGRDDRSKLTLFQFMDLDNEPEAIEQSDDEESESAVDGFLCMFTSTKGWVMLEGGILSQ